MARSVLALLIAALVAAACSSPQVAGPSATPVAGSPSERPSEAPSDPASPSETPAPSGPVEHPATGLTLVQWPDPADPASQVFVVEADGSLRQVTGASGSMPGAATPAWSPDGEWLAFSSAKVGAPVIPPVGVVRADGSEEHVIGLGVNPRWSPDSTRVVFQEVVDIERPLLMFLAEIESGDMYDIGLGEQPQFTPDGRVAFIEPLGETTAGFRLMTRILDSGDPGTEIARNAFGDWSPDGSAVLLESEDGVFLAGADGSNPRDLVGGWGPAWSPDGSLVAVNVGHNSDAVPILAVIDLDGRVIWSNALGESAAWSPDGTRIAVEVSYPEPAVHVLDAATGEILAEYPDSIDPTWVP